MESRNRNASTEIGDSTAKKNVKFNPADYLPRRTIRACAHTATEAFKQSVKVEKMNPNKLTAPTEAAVKQKAKPSKSKQKAKPSKSKQKAKPSKSEQKAKPSKSEQKAKPSKSEQKAKPSKSEQKAKPSKSEQKAKPSGTGNSLGKTPAKRKPPRSQHDCFVKLVRCEDNPTLRTLVEQLKKEQKIVNKKSCSAGAKRAQNHADDDLDSDADAPPWAKQRKTGSSPAVLANGAPNSTYEVVYVPAYAREKTALSHVSHSVLTEKAGSSSYFPPYTSSCFPPYTSTSASSSSSSTGPKTHGAPAGGSQKSLSLVVVHPKPGSKIVNTSPGRSSKSQLLQRMMMDPDTVISKSISRVTTSAGTFELQCGMCLRRFSVVRDLINHKRLAHACAGVMCVCCAGEFPSEAALSSHVCRAKYRCDICGTVCKQAGYLAVHKKMAHKKTLGSYMCYVCGFHAGSPPELNTHRCGGRPSKGAAPAGPSSSTVMVYPKWDVGSAAARPASAAAATPNSNIYVNISAEGPGSGAGDNGMQFLCEVCLNMYASRTALDTHKCRDPIAAACPEPLKAAALAAGGPKPVVNTSFEVMPEVEQLAKFYSSVVFKD